MNKEIVSIRVDERLIHAQIILVWVKHLNINSIIIVDDEIAKNPFLKQIYLLTTPPTIKIEVFTEEQMIMSFNKQNERQYKKRRRMIVMKNIQTAVHLYEAGLRFNNIQIDGRVVKNNKHAVAEDMISDEERYCINFFNQLNIHVYVQKAPGDAKITLNDFHTQR